MHRLTEPSLKLQVYLPASLKQEIEAAAELAGQTLSTFVTRTLSAAMQKEATK
jgi:uncharacterized protein (DUF1778 family)